MLNKQKTFHEMMKTESCIDPKQQICNLAKQLRKPTFKKICQCNLYMNI